MKDNSDLTSSLSNINDGLPADIDEDIESLIVLSEGRRTELTVSESVKLMGNIAHNSVYRKIFMELCVIDDLEKGSRSTDKHKYRSRKWIFNRSTFVLAACLVVGLGIYIFNQWSIKYDNSDIDFDLYAQYIDNHHKKGSLQCLRNVEPVMPATWQQPAARVIMGQEPPYNNMKLSTVIVKSKSSHGSGVFISNMLNAKLILTNYHVIEDEVQNAALSGEKPWLEIITCEYIQDEEMLVRRKSKGATGNLNAEVIKIDPLKDIALLKLADEVDYNIVCMPLLPTEFIPDRQKCFAIGSPGGKWAWTGKEGVVLRQVHFPDDLTKYIVSDNKLLEDTSGLWLNTKLEEPLEPGDSGGPLFNENGQIIGLNVATFPDNNASLHISVKELKAFMDAYYNNPEMSPIPVDIWKAGNCGGRLLYPQLVDIPVKKNIVIRGLSCIYDAAPPDIINIEPIATCLYLNFVELNSSDINLTDLPFSTKRPYGLWGRNQGEFRFNIVMISRNDGISIVGYTDSRLRLNHIRVDHDNDNRADVIWECNHDGNWSLLNLKRERPLIEMSNKQQQQYARKIFKNLTQNMHTYGANHNLVK